MDVDGGSPAAAAPAPPAPRDARAVDDLLRSMGIANYEPRVISQLLEFSHRYATHVLEDADDYRHHCDRETVEEKDVALAIKMKESTSFAPPPPRELLLNIAQDRNKMPLPLVPSRYGVLLPPDRYCLTAPNYDVQASKRPRTNQ